MTYNVGDLVKRTNRDNSCYGIVVDVQPAYGEMSIEWLHSGEIYGYTFSYVTEYITNMSRINE
jgi:hypothetical protein